MPPLQGTSPYLQGGYNGNLQVTGGGGLQSGNNAIQLTQPTINGIDLQNGQNVTGNLTGVANQAPQYSYADGSYAGSAADVAAANQTRAFYQSQIDALNGQMGQLDNQQNVGLGNIGSSYNLGANRLDQQKAVAKRNYDTSVESNNQNYLNTRTGIMNNVRANTNALQRLLGLNGAGNSSAAYDLVPYAAGLQGTQNLTGAQQTYGNNGRSLDTGWEDTQRGYTNAFEDLNNQKYQQENSLKASIAQTRAGLLDKIAQASGNSQLASGGGYGAAKAAMDPYTAQVQNLLTQITQLGQQYANPVMRTADVAYNAPSLSGYSLGNGRISAPGAAGNIDQTFAPVIAPQQRDEYGNIIQPEATLQG